LIVVLILGLFSECGIAGVLFIATVIYFPSKPLTAPSYTASLKRIEYTKALSKIIRQDCVYICVNTMQFHETCIHYSLVLFVSGFCGFLSSMGDTMLNKES
jgi:hypothetical protein